MHSAKVLFVECLQQRGCNILTVSDVIQIVSTAILVVSIIIAYYFSSKTLKEVRDQMQISVFSEYTMRYSEIIRDLPDAASNEKLSALEEASQEEKNRIMGLMRAYFDLCSEEYYLNKMGRIDQETWSRWERGLFYTVRLATFVDAWESIRKEAYEKDFLNYMDEILSGAQTLQ
jgi:hypothetical protein